MLLSIKISVGFVVLVGVFRIAVGSPMECTSMMAPPAMDMKDIMEACNASFTIPMAYLTEFNSTGVLPDETDKTGMCYIRCAFEKLGLIKDWKLDKPLLQRTMWPATGDSVEVCEMEGKSESNACVRTYAIAKCLMIRAITDARDKQVI